MKWHHGHSLGSGVLGGLLLAGHPWLLVAIGIVVGFALARFGSFLRWLGARFGAQP